MASIWRTMLPELARSLVLTCTALIGSALPGLPAPSGTSSAPSSQHRRESSALVWGVGSLGCARCQGFFEFACFVSCVQCVQFLRIVRERCGVVVGIFVLLAWEFHNRKQKQIQWKAVGDSCLLERSRSRVFACFCCVFSRFARLLRCPTFNE